MTTAINITTKDLANLLDEAEPLTLQHCVDIVAASHRVRAVGPLPPETPLPDHLQDDPLESPATEQNERAVKRREAEDAHAAAQKAAAGRIDLPIGWYLTHRNNGGTIVSHVWIDPDLHVRPSTTPEILFRGARIVMTDLLTAAANIWRAQAEDLVARADLAARVVPTLFAS